MLRPIEVNFKLDKTIKRALTTELMIKSHDINVIEFHISFDGLELTADHTVKVLSVYSDTKSQTNVNCDIVDGKAIYRPDTSIISQSEHVLNYVYVYHGEKSLDVREFLYSVDLSKIDETALKVKEVYDQSYSDLLADFEQALQDYKDSLPQASDLRAEVDVILNKFKTDSDAKLSQYDAEAQQVIADNQTAYEQAEDSRNQASEQAIVDWNTTADALLETVESNESSRVDAEATRKSAETDRVSSESTRETNETTRIIDEDARKSAEVIRLASEVDRVNAENVRAEFYEVFESELGKKASKQQEAWITPTLLNGWTTSDGVYPPISFMKDDFGFVHLRGHAIDGTASQIFVLPSGYRPSHYMMFDIRTVFGPTAIITGVTVSKHGQVAIDNYGDGRQRPLNGIYFKAV